MLLLFVRTLIITNINHKHHPVKTRWCLWYTIKILTVDNRQKGINTLYQNITNMSNCVLLCMFSFDLHVVVVLKNAITIFKRLFKKIFYNFKFIRRFLKFCKLFLNFCKQFQAERLRFIFCKILCDISHNFRIAASYNLGLTTCIVVIISSKTSNV